MFLPSLRIKTVDRSLVDRLCRYCDRSLWPCWNCRFLRVYPITSLCVNSVTSFIQAYCPTYPATTVRDNPYYPLTAITGSWINNSRAWGNGKIKWNSVGWNLGNGNSDESNWSLLELSPIAFGYVPQGKGRFGRKTKKESQVSSLWRKGQMVVCSLRAPR